jgi:hypothetical protein
MQVRYFRSDRSKHRMIHFSLDGKTTLCGCYIRGHWEELPEVPLRDRDRECVFCYLKRKKMKLD